MTVSDYKSWCEEATASTQEPNTSFVTMETELICDSTQNQVTFTCRLATRQDLNTYKKLQSYIYNYGLSDDLKYIFILTKLKFLTV